MDLIYPYTTTTVSHNATMAIIRVHLINVVIRALLIVHNAYQARHVLLVIVGMNGTHLSIIAHQPAPILTIGALQQTHAKIACLDVESVSKELFVICAYRDLILMPTLVNVFQFVEMEHIIDKHIKHALRV